MYFSWLEMFYPSWLGNNSNLNKYWQKNFTLKSSNKFLPLKVLVFSKEMDRAIQGNLLKNLNKQRLAYTLKGNLGNVRLVLYLKSDT